MGEGIEGADWSKAPRLPTIRYEPRMRGWTDQPLEFQLVDLEKLDAEGELLVVHHEGERGYHLKLFVTPEWAISLFVWNTKIFRGQNTLARSYGLIPREDALPDPEEGDRLVAEGRYRLRQGVLTIEITKTYDPSVVEPCRCTYRLRLKGVKEYMSPKHGHSARPEYFLVAVRSGRGRGGARQ